MHPMKALIRCGVTLALIWLSPLQAADIAPSKSFDLHNWKLQVPGPKEFKALQNYSSAYFNLNESNEMCFHLNAAEPGTTPDAHYVRSELRHLPNWRTSETHSLSAEVRVTSNLKPDKVTVVQIHGITEQGADAPPLLRVAVNNGDLVAVIKTTSEGDQNETVKLLKGLGTQSVKIDVTVKAKQLTIDINGEEKLSRNLDYWKFFNYFKAGCYPQTTEGTVDVMFRSLTAK
jgi:hypothetical protein